MTNPPACSSERVIESWRDHTGSSARTHHFGPIQSLANEAKSAGMPSLFKGVMIVLGFASLIYIAAVMF